MTKAIHTILGGKVRLYYRENSPYWQCSTYMGEKKRRTSTKKKSLAEAKDFAEDWYFGLRNLDKKGELNGGVSFAKAARTFEREYQAITQGRRSPKWVQGHKDRIRLHLVPYFEGISVKNITSGVVQDYRVHRMSPPQDISGDAEALAKWKPPARNTIHNEIVTLSMVLKAAQRHGWIDVVPDLSDPYRRQSKVEHRPWFTPNEYKQLYEATRANASKPKQPNLAWYSAQLHDFVLFMANTGLRPDEVKRLEFRDVEIVVDEFSGDRILEIEVRGKRGVGYCKSMPGAVRPFERMRERPYPVQLGKDRAGQLPQKTDLLFPSDPRKMFNRVLEEQNLKFDRHGKARTAYSLRHSYICFRLLEGADIYQVAKNCRTSVEMIEKHYAAHLKDMIDTSLVNVRKGKVRAKPAKTARLKQIGDEE